MKSLVLALALLLPLVARAQAPPSPVRDAQHEAMQQLAFLVGEWEGEGWMDVRGQRYSFRSIETVEPRLDGLVLMVEGRHLSDIPGYDEPVLVHHALAMLTYDPQAGVYRFNTQLHRGGTGRYEGRMDGDAFVWGMDMGQTQIRYTIRLDDQGRWHEVGHTTTDGETWTPFFEMTLRRAHTP